MMGVKRLINNHSYQENTINKQLGGNQKAARIAGASFASKHSAKENRWADALQAYPCYFNLHDSECLSHSNSRRIYAAMVIPLQIDGTTKWDGSSASSMGLKTLYAALLILLRK